MPVGHQERVRPGGPDRLRHPELRLRGRLLRRTSLESPLRLRQARLSRHFPDGPVQLDLRLGHRRLASQSGQNHSRLHCPKLAASHRRCFGPGSRNQTDHFRLFLLRDLPPRARKDHC